MRYNHRDVKNTRINTPVNPPVSPPVNPPVNPQRNPPVSTLSNTLSYFLAFLAAFLSSLPWYVISPGPHLYPIARCPNSCLFGVPSVFSLKSDAFNTHHPQTGPLYLSDLLHRWSLRLSLSPFVSTSVRHFLYSRKRWAMECKTRDTVIANHRLIVRPILYRRQENLSFLTSSYTCHSLLCCC